MNERRYPLAYRLDPMANRTKEELQARDEGGCDAIIVHSLIFGEDGSRSQATASMDGRTGKPLPALELFKTWALLAHDLSLRPDLSAPQNALCTSVHLLLKAAVSGASDAVMRHRMTALLRAQIAVLEE